MAIPAYFQHGGCRWDLDGSLWPWAVWNRSIAFLGLHHGESYFEIHCCTKRYHKTCNMFDCLWCCGHDYLNFLVAATKACAGIMAFACLWVLFTSESMNTLLIFHICISFYQHFQRRHDYNDLSRNSEPWIYPPTNRWDQLGDRVHGCCKYRIFIWSVILSHWQRCENTCWI